jgi:NADPH:quinone reductase-like Zn-dependent oxidoreductase
LRAIIIDAPAAKNNLRMGDAPQPMPGPGEVLIDVAYCGCNFADTMIASGTYPHPKGYPIVGGLEVSGRIATLGPGVTGVKVGDRVAAFLEEAGGFADQCVARVERLIPIPHENFTSQPWRQSIDAVVGGIMDGSLKVPLEETFPFHEAGAMLDRLASRQVAGKLILAVNPS